MAVYEFECMACNHITEKQMPMNNDVQVVPCDWCEHVAKRIMSKSTFHLKGGGWYQTSNRENTTAGRED